MTFTRTLFILICCLGTFPVFAAGTANMPSPGHVTAGVTLNLQDANIRDLIDTVSKATGINFVIDSRVRGKVTVISSTPIQRKALYRVFLSVLDVYGYTAVPDGSVVKIIPLVNARQSSLLHGQGAEIVTRVVQVHYMPAAQMVPMLRPLIPSHGMLAAYAPSNMLIVSDTADSVGRIVQLIRKLDRPDNSQIRVVHLRYASASNIAHILDSLLQQQAAKGGPATKQARVVADPRSNSVLISGDAADRQRLRKLIAEMDTPLPSTGDSHVVFLHYAKAKDVATLLKSLTDAQQQQEKGKGANNAGSITIQADKSINALIITAPQQRAQQLSELARRLDVRPAQVSIEAVIAEVSTDLAQQLGTQIGVLPSTNGNTAPAAAINFTNGTASLVSLASNPYSIGPGLLFGFGKLDAGQTRYGALLNALRTNADTDILSTPSLLTLDNKEAQIVIGKNVPFVTGKYTASSSGTGATTLSSPFQTIERKDVGITLKVTPQINQDSNVRLKIELNVSSLAPSVNGAADLITNTRQITTTVITNSGSIIALGGLIEDNYKNSVQKIPLLGDIPGLGRLFQSTSRQRTKTNLMVFLRPVIVSDQDAADQYTEGKYRFLRQQQGHSPDSHTIGNGTVLPPNIRDTLGTSPPTPPAASHRMRR